MQLALNILISWCFLGLAAEGMGLVQSATRQIPILLASSISLGAYLCYGLQAMGWPLWLAVFLSLLAASGVTVMLDRGLQNCSSSNGQGNWGLLAAGLGIYIIMQAILAIFFGEAGRTFMMPRRSIAIGDAWITETQELSIACCIAVYIALTVIIQYSRLGLAIRGLGSNPELCLICGIETSKVRASAVTVGSGVATLAGLLVAIDSGLIANTGFSVFLTGITSVIIAGVGGYSGIIFASLLLAVSRHLVAYYGNPQWIEASTFIILIAFLIWKPLGFSGRRLKKIEV